MAAQGTPDRLRLDDSALDGLLRLAGRRAVVLDAELFGVLRRDLADTLGLQGARGILSRLGYADGWRMAEALEPKLAPGSEGGSGWLRLLRARGMAIDVPSPSSDALAEATLAASFEAEQHQLRFGRATEPACWMLAGFVSGYLSRVQDRAILCLEEGCVAKGDPHCRLVGRPLEDWPDERQADARFYDEVRLDAERDRLRAELHAAEQDLAGIRRAGVAGPDRGAFEPTAGSAHGLIQSSPATARVFELARRAAKVDSPVLLIGESGVGKETVARQVHAASARAERPFIRVNCAEVPDLLLEAELFGYAKGAFPGAVGERFGYLEAADGGTLFLADVLELPAGAQAKLLRFLETRKLRRLGEDMDRELDVRLIAGSRSDLLPAMRAGKLREDLGYRLAVIRIQVPALCDRREDVVPLAQARLAEIAKATGGQVRSFTASAAHQLARHEWPGNLRQLQNAVEHAATVATGETIELADLPDDVRESAPSGPRKLRSERLAEIERRRILAVLEAARGNRAVAAKILGIGPATLYRKLRSYAEAGKDR